MTFGTYALHYHIWPQEDAFPTGWRYFCLKTYVVQCSCLTSSLMKVNLSNQMYHWSNKIPLVSSRTSWDNWNSDNSEFWDCTEIVCVGDSKWRNCESSRLRLQQKSCKCCLSDNELWESIFHLKATLWFQFCSLTLTSITSTFFLFPHLPVFFFFFFFQLAYFHGSGVPLSTSTQTETRLPWCLKTN